MSTRENPADFPTRRAAVAELKQMKMCWQGSTFQGKEQETWSKTKTDRSPKAAMEVRHKMRTSVGPVQNSAQFPLIPETPSRL